MTFQSFESAVVYGRKMLKRHPEKKEYFLTVHVHLIAVTRDSWCHASLYRPTQEEVAR